MSPMPHTAEEGIELRLLGRRVRHVARSFSTMREAALAACVAPQHLSRIVKGESAPNPNILRRLATKAGFDLHWLLTGEGPKKRTATETAKALRAERESCALEVDALAKQLRDHAAERNVSGSEDIVASLELLAHAADRIRARGKK